MAVSEATPAQEEHRVGYTLDGAVAVIELCRPAAGRGCCGTRSGRS